MGLSNEDNPHVDLSEQTVCKSPTFSNELFDLRSRPALSNPVTPSCTQHVFMEPYPGPSSLTGNFFFLILESEAYI